MNDLSSLDQLEDRIRHIISELRRVKSQQQTKPADPKTEEKISRFEGKIKSIIDELDNII